MAATGPTISAEIRAAYRAANAETLRQRIHLGAAIFAVVGVSLYLLEWEAYLEQPASMGLILVGQVVVCVLAVALAAWERARERLPAVASVAASLLVLTVVVEHVLLGLSLEVMAVTLVSILACAAALLPWGWRAQVAMSLVTVVGFGAAAFLAFDVPAAPHAHAGLLTVAVATVIGAFSLERYRFAAFQRAAGLERVSRENREEAEIAAALVRVGHTLGGAVGRPDVFDRVNRLIVELLGCDWSATATVDADRKVLRIVGLHGVSPEVRAYAESMEFADGSLPLFRELLSGEMVEIEDSRTSELLPAAFSHRYGVSAALAAPIVLNGKVVGAVTNGYTKSRGPFGRKHRQITAGIAQATAIAVENQRLFSDLARANRVKSDFVSTMSHELRTPVNVILGYARVLEEGDAGPLSSEQSDIVTRIRRSGTRLGGLVDGILDLSKLESGAERLKLDWVDIDAFIATLEAEFQAETSGSHLVLDWKNHLAGRRMRTEGHRLRTIVQHLVQNAIKFTPPDGQVRVEFAPSADALVVTVSDSGIGISPDDVESIFDDFHQVDATDSREFGGVGLGLHIVRRLVDRLGGSVAVASEPGSGSVFTVEIPAQFARARGA